MDDLDLISGRTAAKLLRVTPATITNRVRTGALKPFARLDNGGYIFQRAEIAKLVERAESPALPPRAVVSEEAATSAA